MQSSGSGGGLGPLVNFYSKLPKGPASTTAAGGIKGRFFNGKNASAAPLLFTILGIMGLGYTIDYQSAYRFLESVLDGGLGWSLMGSFCAGFALMTHVVHLSEYMRSMYTFGVC